MFLLEDVRPQQTEQKKQGSYTISISKFHTFLDLTTDFSDHI